MGTLRVYLAGKVCVERDDRLVPERRLPGGQGRLVFAYLAAEHERAVHRDELADELWHGEPPRAWEAALRVVVSKLRAVLEDVGLDGSAAVSSALGCYQIRFPAGTWIDLEAAADAAHLAERALRAGRPDEANGWTLVASSIARRPFLAGAEGAWVTRKREELRRVRVRALECRAEVLLGEGDHALAVQDMEEVLSLDPFRESGYRLLMRAHCQAGNLAEALRAFERCRVLLADQLGTSPSTVTQDLYLEILRST